MPSYNDDQKLEDQIQEALGPEGTKEQVRHVRLLCKELLREMQDDCRHIAQEAVNAVGNLHRRP